MLIRKLGFIQRLEIVTMIDDVTIMKEVDKNILEVAENGQMSEDSFFFLHSIVACLLSVV